MTTERLFSILVAGEWAIVAYFVLVNGFYLVLLVSAGFEMRRHVRSIRGESRWRILGSAAAPRISVIAPAYNEESTIGESVPALLALFYPNLEIVVVNDGSRDATVDVLRDQYDLVPIHPIYDREIPCKPIRALYRSRSHPNLVVVDKENGGKADALNAGLNLSTGELVCAIDSDTLIEPDALQRMVRPFLTGDEFIAAGGTIRVANGSSVRWGRVSDGRVARHPIAGIQTVEYLRAYLFGRLGWNQLGGNLIISGAFGLFDRDAVRRAGGYAHDTVGEDMELVIRLRRIGYERGEPHGVAFVPDPVAWTEVPESLKVLGRQRDRWHRGLADVLWRHRTIFFNRRYGAMGMVAFPYFVLVELLAPVVEAIGLIGLVLGLSFGVINWPFAVLFFLAAYGLGLVLSIAGLLLEEFSFHRYWRVRDRLVLLGWAVLENLGFRQLTVVWRLRGLWKYLRGRTDWGSMERKGFQRSPQRPDALSRSEG
jgi:cellulose synthase/poly-beta-1,6-N-acetylglucosamine synthase-like glycosyltransferase